MKPGSEYLIVLEMPDGSRVEHHGCVDDLLGVGPDSNFTVTPGPWKDYLEAKFGRDLTTPEDGV